MGDDSDARLWARVLDDDESGLAALFDRHHHRLFRRACRLLSTREDAKDAVVIAFSELWRRRRTVRVVDGSPVPWLVTTTTNVSLNLERSARRYRALLAKAPAEDAVDPPVAHDETGVFAALRRLPTTQRSVVVLSVLEGYPERDVAAALGISVGTVKSRLSRAKARLRDDLSILEG